ncbi:hypothetical protein [Rheinheimera sp.]|uniref:hypothetical protein n=1 Tax=Rheinheimera sp. TaxID=1869214 RepID=UPI0027BAE820|nr:hypothetical protein [Rheinheimera sp.]
MQFQQFNRQFHRALLLAFVLATSSAAADTRQIKTQSRNNCSSELLQGSWQLQSAIYSDSTGKVVAEIQQQSSKSRKLIAGQYFSFITWQAEGKFEVAATGTFYSDNTGYHEQVEAASLPRLQGKTYHFQCELNGNNWLHQGMEDGVYIKEHWIKLDAGQP